MNKYSEELEKAGKDELAAAGVPESMIPDRVSWCCAPPRVVYSVTARRSGAVLTWC